MIDAQSKHWHEIYELLSSTQRDIVDDAFKEVVGVLNASGTPASLDDRAEVLIAAITRYLVTSERN